MKFFQQLTAALLLILIPYTMSAQGNKLIGRWKSLEKNEDFNSYTYYEFLKNRTWKFIIGDAEWFTGKYKIQRNRLTLSSKELDDVKCKFSISNDILTITNEETKKVDKFKLDKPPEKPRILYSDEEIREEVSNIDRFKNAPKPKRFKLIKKLITTHCPDWRIQVSLGSDGDYSYSDPVIWRGIEILFNLKKPSSVKKGELKLSYARLERTWKGEEEEYLIISWDVNDNKYESIAPYSKDIKKKITDLNLKTGDTVAIFYDYVDDVPAEEGEGSVVVVIIREIFTQAEYLGFGRYVVGHPKEFNPKKYLEIIR